MNKKVFIMPIAICAMGLASCNGTSNRGLSRHSFKESTLENVQKIITGLEEKQWTGKKSQTGNVTMQEKKVSVNAYSESKFTSTYDDSSTIVEHVHKYEADLDQDNKTGLFNISEYDLNYPYSGFSSNYNAKDGFKMKDDGSVYAFYEAGGEKMKYKVSSQFKDFNTLCLHYFANESYYVDFIGQVGDTAIANNLAIDLFGGYKDEHSVRSVFFGETQMLSKFIAKNATVTYGSNDDNSVMIALKGTLPYKDFYECVYVTPEPEEKFEGTVDFDYFFGLENCFVTQFEGTTKYNKTKQIRTYANKEVVHRGLDGEVYGKIDVNYKGGPTLNINLDDYIEFDF